MAAHYYTISAVAQEAASDQGLYSEHMYFQYESWALSGYREAQFDFAQEIKTVLIPMNSLRVAELPCDCIDWIKIGIKIGERVYTVGLNTDMARINEADSCGNLLPNTPRQPVSAQPRGINMNAYIPAYFVFSNFNGQSIQGQTDPKMGIQDGLSIKEYFDIEGKYPNIRIRFSSEMMMAAQVYVEYISDGIEPSGETYVNPYMYEYLRTYIHYRRTEGNDNISLGVKRDWETKMERKRNIAAQRINSITPDDVINSSRKGFKLTLKV